MKFSLLLLLLSLLAFSSSDGAKLKGHREVFVRVGHLLPNNPTIAHEPDVLRIGARDLKSKKVLPFNVTIQVTTMESCNDFSGVEHGAYLHYIHNATFYLGPGCNNEMLVMGRLASRWNVPIVAHMSGDDILSDRKEFPTLGSVALTSASEMARATLTYLQLNNWKQVGFVRASTNHERLSLHSLSNLLRQRDIAVNVVIDLDPYMSVEEIIHSGKLKQLRSNARIIIVELGLDIHAAMNFMLACKKSDMKSDEFVYVLPWLSHLNDHYPWEASNVDKQEMKSAFESVIAITAHGYDRKFIDDFQFKFAQETGILASHFGTLAYMSLYDALFLYGYALRDAYDERGGDPEVNFNGTLIWNKMANRQFNGVTGQVLMNHKAIRVPSYATYHISNGTVRIVVELESKLGDLKQCQTNEEMCSQHVAHEIIPNYWPSYNGQVPPDVPGCGYTGVKCDYSTYFFIAGALLFVFTIIPLGIFVYIKQKERQLYDMTWRVPRDTIKFVESHKAGKSTSTLSSTNTTTTSNTQSSGSFSGSLGSKKLLDAKQAVVNGIRVAVKRFQQVRNINFSKRDLRLLKELRVLENENLNRFFGIAFNQQNEFVVMWVVCSRGSLEDILFSDDLKLGRNFQVSFAKDVVKGVYYLHTSPVAAHGLLCLQNCLVDSNWTVRLSNFVSEHIIAEKIYHNEIRVVENEDDSQQDVKKDRYEDRKYLQQAPEVVRDVLTKKVLPPPSQAADIYALGMVLYQILYRVEPFHERGKTVKKLMEMVAMANDDDQLIRPVFPTSSAYGQVCIFDRYYIRSCALVEMSAPRVDRKTAAKHQSPSQLQPSQQQLQPKPSSSPFSVQSSSSPQPHHQTVQPSSYGLSAVGTLR